MTSFLQRTVALLIFLLTLPLYPIIFAAIKLETKGPFIFQQKRVGKSKKPFTIYKFRTMIEGAEKLQKKYSSINEAHGPVFKIRNDPRYTKVGKLLARTTIDEWPQFINIIEGTMTFIGPRPLPVEESKKIPSKYSRRYDVLPGLTSPWVICGGHKLTFKQWMELDLTYVKSKNIWYDIKIIIGTIILIVKSLFHLHD